MKTQTKVIIGAITAVALGSVIVGLFTTNEGWQARKKLAKKTRKLRNKTLQQVGELKVGSRRRFETVKEATNNIIDQGKELVSGIAGKTGNTGSAQ